ncbi:hypothetical protein ACFL6S_03420 [Candidatus Poribacteria bacterium]
MKKVKISLHVGGDDLSLIDEIRNVAKKHGIADEDMNVTIRPVRSQKGDKNG